MTIIAEQISKVKRTKRDSSITDRAKIKTNQTRRRILLLVSSNGRGCSEELQNKLSNNFEVSGIVKPNGKLGNVIESIEPLTKDFNKNDCVIILGGDNDIGINENYDCLLYTSDAADE